MANFYKPSVYIALFLSIFFFPDSAFSQDYVLKNLHIFKGTQDWVTISQQMGKDANGNIFGFCTFSESFVGAKDSFSSSSSSNSDIVISRFSADGEISRNIHVDFAKYDKATDVAISKNNEIYISGSFQNSYVADSSVILLKCDTSGKILWNLKVKDGECMGQGVCVDNEGNCYVSGYIGDSLIIDNYSFKNDKKTRYGSFIIKLNPEGKIIWIRTAVAKKEKIETTDMKFERMNPHIHAIRSDKNGDLYFVGHFSGHVNLGSLDIFTTRNFNNKITGYNETYYIGKLYKDGEILWLTNENAPGMAYTDKLIFDSDFNIYLDLSGNSRGQIQKYSPDGQFKSSITKRRRELATVSQDEKYFLYDVGILNSNKDTIQDFFLEFSRLPANHIMADDSNYIYIKTILRSKDDTAKVEGKNIPGPAVIYTRYYFSVLKLSPKNEENNPQPKNDTALQIANAGQIDHPTPDETDHLRRSKLTTKNRSKLTT